MIESYHAAQNYVMAICLWSLAFLGCALLRHATGALRDLVRRWCGMSPLGRGFALLSLVFVTLTGSTKGFRFDGGIKQDDDQPSVATNSTVEIHWLRDTSGGVYVPDIATVYIDYRETSDANGVWQSLGSTTVGQWQYAATLANATNYDYSVWAYYIPPEPVHTNDMWVYKTLRDRAEKHPLPLRARVEVNGKAIATPCEKRKDEERE